MNVWKFGSWLDAWATPARPSVDGTLWIALAKFTTASVSVVRYFTNSQAAFCFSLVLAIPTIVPVM